MRWDFLDFCDICFPSTLAGKAKTWYDQLPQTRVLLITNLEQLTDLFFKECQLTETDQDSADERLLCLKQKLTESLDDFASRYRTLCNESGKDIDSSNIFKHFIKGLSNETVRVALRTKAYSSF
uniref:Retrotransposon gag domain-containing protein n=1 Tax=Chromera velia CCMP2878 TaxID=1169474 RepID=A0A0G4F4B1_9ALVE|eukprot:Cvel_14984.t1-p1 / transcript=Cvel_14984.t1 / gene=Cvel_14984 / organism=Chromera_velia_CCMP2878 / gene_product=hypothetical protein / transcript_product=hypothetical protein / location=Cvel_scaffold1089:49201-49569(-) / protein_length=123 / sequence_SO=supercontig / SO=protein_coding / is_pseudo=false